MDSRCGMCGEPLYVEASVRLGFGPKCAQRLGLSPLDLLPQRCKCCRHSEPVLRLLYGFVGLPKFIEGVGWIDRATGELVVRLEVIEAVAS